MQKKEIEYEELTQTIKQHRKYLHGEGGKRADLSGADLSYAMLHRADLHRAKLRGVTLYRADFKNANLKGVDFSGANISVARNVPEAGGETT